VSKKGFYNVGIKNEEESSFETDFPLACTINVFTVVIYDCNDSGQYYKTKIMIVIDDPS
jgi:hypothetical protein